jgi:hypothetical protein
MLCGFNGKIGRESSFNNDAKYEGVTSNTPCQRIARKFEEVGYIVNHAWVKIGSGHDVFMKGKQLLQNWGGMFLSSVTEFHHQKKLQPFMISCLYLCTWDD